VDNFSDPMIDNKDSKKRYRVDHLLEAHAEKLKEIGEEKEADEFLQFMDAFAGKR
jgi:glycyl-tRNA synthetase